MSIFRPHGRDSCVIRLAGIGAAMIAVAVGSWVVLR